MISVLSLAVIFSAFEIGTRVYYSQYSFTNFLAQEKTLSRSQHPTEYHPELGWVPKTGTYEFITQKDRVHTRESKSTITISEDGIRANSRRVASSSNETILAIGDSFTFGDGVSDSETWPAILEELSGKRVINGGVFGYGIDQSFLRMKMLVRKYKPDIIIFSFIPDDIRRCELSYRAARKPYYDVSDGKLILYDEHLSSKSDNQIASRYKSILGYSFFVHKVMMERFKGYWLQGVGSGMIQVHDKGEEVSCLILQEVKKYAVKQQIKIYRNL